MNVAPNLDLKISERSTLIAAASPKRDKEFDNAMEERYELANSLVYPNYVKKIK